MERKRLLPSQHIDYHSCPSSHGYEYQRNETGEHKIRAIEENASKGTSPAITHAQLEREEPSAYESSRPTEEREKFSGVQGHYLCTTTWPDGIEIQTNISGSDTDGSINPKAPQDGTWNDRDGATEKDLQVVADVVLVRNQRKRVFLLTLIGFIVAAGEKLNSPLLTQYTYQVYTEQVYGSNSADIHVSKEPCVNSSSNSSTDTRIQQVRDESKLLKIK